jgi:hypothetical protein
MRSSGELCDGHLLIIVRSRLKSYNLGQIFAFLFPFNSTRQLEAFKVKMKTIVFSVVMLIAFGTVRAQITITQGTFAPIGFTFSSYNTSASVAITPGPSGANQSWTIPTLTFDPPAAQELVNPAATPLGATFPTATHAQGDVGAGGAGGVWSYYRVAADSYSLLGQITLVSGVDTLIFAYNPTQLLAPLPLSYPHGSWTAVSQYSYEAFPGFFIVVRDSVINELDGWGTITTQFGNWQVLRARLHRYNMSGLQGLPPTITESTQYIWTTQNGLPVAALYSLGWDPNFTSAYVTLTIPGTTTADPVRGPVAKNFSVQQNYPNPFNPTTTIPVELSQNGDVTLRIYNETGQLISEENMNLPAGSHALPIHAENWSSGNYFANVSQNAQTQTVKMQLVK